MSDAGDVLVEFPPKVYLAIEATGWAKCSYCGAEYTLNRSAPGNADIKSEADIDLVLRVGLFLDDARAELRR